jgi:hypothetical protein
MVKMTPQEWQQLGKAIVIWSGRGRASHPSRNGELVAEHFGRDLAAKLLPMMRELEKEFYSSDARHAAADLSEMARISADQFLEKHPHLPAEAAHALAWCYTFDYK